jgi:hypothetical protein
MWPVVGKQIMMLMITMITLKSWKLNEYCYEYWRADLRWSDSGTASCPCWQLQC